ncbi:hypothetical protein CU097_014587 [Rhizopus azygosporus]|uniref:Uncharacterized protein n=1 Tax=Rhizopus azygosporus TaxID=86630 RepID=A0A367K7R6_RHIAZ|nr:hypothetical protein CU097_014587 [Rhizopus azygosporus]
MTHLSDYSFLQRAVGLVYIYIWYIYRVYQTNGFKCLSFASFKRLELKTIVTGLIFFMIPFQLYYDIVSCRVKYEEGFVQIGPGRIITKPELLWTKADKDIIIPTDYSICIGFSLQTGTLLLLQCFWNYLIKLVAGARFMSSKEFKVYIIWTIVNIILFPVLQFNFSRKIYDYTYKEIMPELVYGIELLAISMLGVVSHFRFRRLLYQLKDHNDSAFMTSRIRYYQDLNLILSVALFLFSSALVVLTVDGLTEAKRLNRNKFDSDFLICNVNVGMMAVWIIVILVLHPKTETKEVVAVETAKNMV